MQEHDKQLVKQVALEEVLFVLLILEAAVAGALQEVFKTLAAHAWPLGEVLCHPYNFR